MPAAASTVPGTEGSMTPSPHVFSITPHNVDELTHVARQIYVGVGGDVALVDVNGNSVIHKNASAGGYIGPFYVKQVLATGTTATDLVGYA